jgi:hypothetical protein
MDVPWMSYGRCMTPEGEPLRNWTAANARKASFFATRNASFVVMWFIKGLTSFVVLVRAG